MDVSISLHDLKGSLDVLSFVSSQYFLGCDVTWVLLAVWKKMSQESNLFTSQNRWWIELSDINIILLVLIKLFQTNNQYSFRNIFITIKNTK